MLVTFNYINSQFMLHYQGPVPPVRAEVEFLGDLCVVWQG